MALLLLLAEIQRLQPLAKRSEMSINRPLAKVPFARGRARGKGERGKDRNVPFPFSL
jgi:hypothetical protein